MSAHSAAGFAGETLWLTGASSGIGRELALQLARAGAHVIASARSREGLQALADQHPNITPLPFDVTDEHAIESTRQQLLQLTPSLNRVILNAGTCEYLDIKAPDWSMMNRIMAVNYAGAINTLAVALPLLESCATRAHIIGIASLVTVAPFPQAEAYGASKAALRYFLDAMRADCQDHLDVTVINPGFVQTPLTDKNDFSMPFLMTAPEAVSRMLAAILRRPQQYDFPRRLKWLLTVLMAIPGLWYSVIVPRLRR